MAKWNNAGVYLAMLLKYMTTTLNMKYQMKYQWIVEKHFFGFGLYSKGESHFLVAKASKIPPIPQTVERRAKSAIG